MTEYKNAMVIGKFMPFHKGHKKLIQFARFNAKKTYILVLGNKNEFIPLSLRKEWIKEEYAKNEDVMVVDVEYDETKLNSSSESDVKSSEEWSDFLMGYIKAFGIDVIIGSERYVQYMADYIGINYIIYDEKRTNLHISATDIKNDIINNWDYLVPSVKRYFAKHVCICGSESSGKTTVCKQLEDAYEYVTMIPEIGRCLVGNASTCEHKTLGNVLSIHESLLKCVINDPPTPIILWDTDNITTLSYCDFLFGSRPFINDVPLADKYFFFDSTIPYAKDATRIEESEAMKLREHHLKMYDKYNIKLTLVERARFETVDNYVTESMREIKELISGRVKLPIHN